MGLFELGEARLLGTNLVQDALEKVKVLLRVSPMKDVMRFGKKGKLSPKFIGHFEILQRVGEVSYELALPPSLAGVHSVFHVSMLRKYHGDPSYVLDFSSVQLDKDISYVEESVVILDRQVRKLRSKNIASVKGLYSGKVLGFGKEYNGLYLLKKEINKEFPAIA
ncbi:uncharacterized protein [Nicotiana sylvestris]|uniref:uncharacterized protein n=1 Tax=Nicotiana sylvestris TaxID=4096 RepID=UPI00388C4E61